MTDSSTARRETLSKLSEVSSPGELAEVFPDLSALVRLLLDRPSLPTRASRSVVRAVGEVLSGTSVLDGVEASTFLQGVEVLAFASQVSPLLSSDRLERLVRHAAGTPRAYRPLLDEKVAERVAALVSRYDEAKRERLLVSLWDSSHDERWWEVLETSLRDPFSRDCTDFDESGYLDAARGLFDGERLVLPDEAKDASWWSYQDDRGEQISALAAKYGSLVIDQLYEVCDTLPSRKKALRPSHQGDYNWVDTPLLVLLQAAKGVKVSKRFFEVLDADPALMWNTGLRVLANNVLPALPYLPQEALDLLMGSPAFVAILPDSLQRFHPRSAAVAAREFLRQDGVLPEIPESKRLEWLLAGIVVGSQREKLLEEYPSLDPNRRCQLLSSDLPFLGELAALETDASVVTSALEASRHKQNVIVALAPYVSSWGGRNALLSALTSLSEIPAPLVGQAADFGQMIVESKNVHHGILVAELLAKANVKVPLEVLKVVESNHVYLGQTARRNFLRQGATFDTARLARSNDPDDRVTLAHQVGVKPAALPKNPMSKLVKKSFERSALQESPQRPKEWKDLAPVRNNIPYDVPRKVKALDGAEVPGLAGVTVSFLSTPQELHANATQMGNCTFGYDDECADGRYAIFALEVDETLYNFSVHRPEGTRRWRLDQVESRFNNGHVPKRLFEGVKELAATLR